MRSEVLEERIRRKCLGETCVIVEGRLFGAVDREVQPLGEVSSEIRVALREREHRGGVPLRELVDEEREHAHQVGVVEPSNRPPVRSVSRMSSRSGVPSAGFFTMTGIGVSAASSSRRARALLEIGIAVAAVGVGGALARAACRARSGSPSAATRYQLTFGGKGPSRMTDRSPSGWSRITVMARREP